MDRYPASFEALKVASLLPRTWAKALLARSESSRRTVQNLCRKLDAVLRARTRKSSALVQMLHPGKTLKYKTADGTKELKVEDTGNQTFEELLSTLPREIRENRWSFRLAELLTYGSLLQEIPLEEAVGAEEPPESGPEGESN